MLPLTVIEGSDGSDFTVLGTRLPSSFISFPFVQAEKKKTRIRTGISLFFWLFIFLRFLQIWPCEKLRIAPFCKVALASLKKFTLPASFNKKAKLN